MGLPPRVVGGLGAVETLCCRTRDIGCWRVELPGASDSGGAASTARSNSPCTARTRSRSCARYARAEKPRGRSRTRRADDDGCRRSGPDDRKVVGGPRQDTTGAGAMKRAVERRESRKRDSDEENREKKAHGERKQGKPLSHRELRPCAPLPVQVSPYEPVSPGRLPTSERPPRSCRSPGRSSSRPRCACRRCAGGTRGGSASAPCGRPRDARRARPAG